MPHVMHNHQKISSLRKMSRTKQALCLLTDLELALYSQEIITEKLEKFVRDLPLVADHHRPRYIQNLRELQRFLARVNAEVHRLNPIRDILQ